MAISQGPIERAPRKLPFFMYDPRLKERQLNTEYFKYLICKKLGSGPPPSDPSNPQATVLYSHNPYPHFNPLFEGKGGLINTLGREVLERAVFAPRFPDVPMLDLFPSMETLLRPLKNEQGSVEPVSCFDADEHYIKIANAY